MVSLFERTHSLHGPWYSFQDALQDAAGLAPLESELTLYESGCHVDDGWNCTAACLDPALGPALLWDGPEAMYTLQNCMVLPLIAYLLANGSLSQRQASLASKYSIEADLTLWSREGWPVINGCMRAACEESSSGAEDCELSSSLWQPITYPLGQPNAPQALRVNASLCDCLDTSLDSDIGGMGMLVAYIMQAIIVLYASVLYHLHKTWICSSMFVLLLLGESMHVIWDTVQSRLYTAYSKVPSQPRRSRSGVTAHSWELASRLQAKATSTRHTAALMHALVEFHKTQVYFILAFQTASLVALHNPAWLQASSWQQIRDNTDFLIIIALSGCAPVLLANLVLQSAGKSSWSMLRASTCTVFVSVISYAIAVYKPPKPHDILEAGRSLPECGGHASPTLYCYQAAAQQKLDPARIAGSLGYPSLCVGVLIILLLDKTTSLCALSLKDEGAQVHLSSNPQTRRRHNRRSVLRSAYRGLHILAETAMVFLTMALLVTYATLTSWTASRSCDGAGVSSGSTRWTLGQIVSIAIWVPILVEYVKVLCTVSS